MLNIFKIIVLFIFIFFLNDFYLDTFTNEKFRLEAKFKILDVINYHYRYPSAFLTFLTLIFFPCVYYAFIRGVRFYEKGFVYNRGLPFLSKIIFYSEIDSYKLIHPEHILSITTKSGEIYVVADNSMERVLGIIDQQGIKGDLAKDDYVKLIANYKKFILIVLSFTAFIFVLQKFGFFLNR